MSASALNSRFGLRVHQSSRGGPGPSVHLFLQGVVRHANGMLAITPDCASLAEMEGQIELLKAELDEMLRQTQRAFSRG
jgi:hypothetical protein